jgi:hypothetical protein
MSPVRAASWRSGNILTACNFTSPFATFFRHFVDFQLDNAIRYECRIWLRAMRFFAKSNAIGQEATQFASWANSRI